MTVRTSSTAISVSLPNDVYSRVKTAARSRGLSVSGYLADAARAELARDALAEIVSEAETHQGHAISTQDLEHANEEIEAELGGSDNEAAA